MLARLITETALDSMAGPRAFERGAAYFESGAVTDLVDTGKAIKARVLGTEEYAVRLWAEDGELGYDCTCPVGDDGEFCKHAVAAGLAWLARRTDGAGAGARGDKDLAAVRDWLERAPRETLMELLMEQVEDDAGLRHRLHARAARAQAVRHIDLKELKQTVSKALAVHGFVDYHGMRRLLDRASSVVDLLSGLREDGHANAAWELAHHALERAIAAYETSDDSGGAFGDLLHRVAAEHLAACRAARPDAAVLGKQLFDFMRRDQWGLAAFDDYAPLMGDAGLKVFRAAAEKEWKNVPARGPGKNNGRTESKHFQITRIMEALALRAGDVDALVAIKTRDLTVPYRFLQVAEILVEAGRRDEALAWAERGHETFSDRPDSRLVEFLADEYGRRNRHEVAIALIWEQFQQQPALSSYQRLKTCTERAGAWVDWRTKALAWLREGFLNAEKRERPRWSWRPGGHSLLVEIFLWEGDSDAALAEAKAGGCTETLWFALARAREKDHPQDAAAIYQARLDNIVQRGNNRAYDEAAALVGRIRGLMRRTKQEKEFAIWLETVRARHKAKRNFMQRLNAVSSKSR